MQPRTSSGFIDRLLVTAEAYHIPAALVFNKVDLYDEKALNTCDEWCKLYESLGYPVFVVSALSGTGVSDLKSNMAGQVNLFAGHSGVGKSALLNALDPALTVKTGEISGYHNKGMHTTTYAEMFPLFFGGYIIDTPGIKEFGLVHFESREIAERFPEFRQLMHECKYNNCLHLHEPGCAVKLALNEGRIHKQRYRNYLSLLNDENLDETDYQ
jgi:ribosome biogenesis GTPase